ncbi:putative polysaccharide biosynthesis protein [Caldalkalibacillus mannanilyticus]|uniref:putative polysaccharide biosynthesis protein n=1 Tax=Caldalkalibacillus mannanilyticus TaxID=1418 RepID=UPI00046A2C46|nr:polysaccharide biosynthesis protein [Caldalkalibacillus mannanilyticus]
MSNFVRGTMILTAAIFISKILGFIYVVPFKALVGTQGYVLYNYAYQAYIVLLSFTTMGIPLAVSKFVSKYNELGDYETGRRLFRSGLLLMLGTGLVSFILLFIYAPSIALVVIDPHDTSGNSLEDITHVIRMVSMALLIVPAMGIIRGYFQGHHSMGPTAVSQVIEQIVRIIFILICSYLVLRVWNGALSTAVGFATFGAFVGGVGGMATLYYYWRKRRSYLERPFQNRLGYQQVTYWNMYKELISYAIPFVFVGLTIPLYSFIDTFTINQALTSIGYKQGGAEEINAVMALVQKVILVPVALATAMSLTLVPIITKAYTSKDQKLLHQYVTQSFQVIIYITLPMVVYMSVMSYPIYTLLYSLSEYLLGGKILRWYAPTAILFALFTVTAAILQGINLQRYVLLSLSIGIVFKAFFNTFFIIHFEELGPIIATNAGFLFSISLNLVFIRRFLHYRFKHRLKQHFLILLQVMLATLGLIILKWISEILFTIGRLESFIVVGVTGSLFVLLYIWLGLRSNLLFIILGDRVRVLDRFKKKKMEA